jgi:hypothetical protein
VAVSVLAAAVPAELRRRRCQRQLLLLPHVGGRPQVAHERQQVAALAVAALAECALAAEPALAHAAAVGEAALDGICRRRAPAGRALARRRRRAQRPGWGRRCPPPHAVAQSSAMRGISGPHFGLSQSG